MVGYYNGTLHTTYMTMIIDHDMFVLYMCVTCFVYSQSPPSPVSPLLPHTPSPHLHPLYLSRIPPHSSPPHCSFLLLPLPPHSPPTSLHMPTPCIHPPTCPPFTHVHPSHMSTLTPSHAHPHILPPYAHPNILPPMPPSHPPFPCAHPHILPHAHHSVSWAQVWGSPATCWNPSREYQDTDCC